MAPSLASHPLLDLFLKRLDPRERPSNRILGFRELEKSLAQQSELVIGPLRAEIDKLSSQYAFLSQSKDKEFELDLLKSNLQRVKNVYNTTVVSTEHLWRELSHLYAADPLTYSKF